MRARRSTTILELLDFQLTRQGQPVVVRLRLRMVEIGSVERSEQLIRVDIRVLLLLVEDVEHARLTRNWLRLTLKTIRRTCSRLVQLAEHKLGVHLLLLLLLVVADRIHLHVHRTVNHNILRNVHKLIN